MGLLYLVASTQMLKDLKYSDPNCYILLTVHPNTMIVFFFYQLDAQILYFNTFITFLCMFRALLCSSSGGQLC